MKDTLIYNTGRWAVSTQSYKWNIVKWSEVKIIYHRQKNKTVQSIYIVNFKHFQYNILKKIKENMTSSIARSIQIVQPTSKHAFQLKISDLETILNAEDIRNRCVVVISIAGALRQGKSFLLNFYLQYLYAQVSKTDWSSIRFLSRTQKI